MSSNRATILPLRDRKGVNDPMVLNKTQGKRQVNWRIREDTMIRLEAEAQKRGFSTVPALVNTILAERYAKGERPE